MATACPASSTEPLSHPRSAAAQVTSRSHDGRRKAFTLIELLVVVAIIALLISILLPAMSGAREAGRSSVCMSNQRQIGLAVVMYADTYKEYTLREGWDSDEREKLPWAVGLRPFIDPTVSADADPDDLFERAAAYRCPTRYDDGHNITYVVNGFAFSKDGKIDTANRKYPTQMSKYPRPHDTLYLTDYADDPNGSDYRSYYGSRATDMSVAQWYDIWAKNQVSGAPNQLRIAPKRHGNGTNAVFLDGHSDRVRAEILTTLERWDDGDYSPQRPPR